MSQFTLVIGNKNYSSWSMRPWLLMRQAGLAFEEVRIPLYGQDSAEPMARWCPSGLVPTLHDGDTVVWDSLAICEYLAERFPEAHLWPEDVQARALARSVSAEMHAGFSALRSAMPMNCRGHFPGRGLNPQSEKDIARIQALWGECRERFGSGGEFLFGRFSIADAMYAPVVLRFSIYGVELDHVCRRYAEAILSLPAVQEWVGDGKAEAEVIEAFEIY